MRKGNFSREKGFTLLEILISLTLVMMMAVGLWSLFRVSVTSWKRGIEATDANQRRRSITDLVHKQMASVYGVTPPPDIQSGGMIYPLFFGAAESLQFVSVNSLRFQRNPGLTMVSYDLIRDKQGNYMLIQREAQFLLMDSSRESIMDQADETFLMIFDSLTSFSFEYFDPGTNAQPARWLREWNPKEAQRLPTAISMTMVGRDSSGNSVGRHMVVPIMAKVNDIRLQGFVNPFDTRPRRFREDGER